MAATSAGSAEAIARRQTASFPALLGNALIGTAAGLGLSVALSAYSLRGGYAGAYDEGAASQALQKYDFFLTAIVRSLAAVALGEAICLTPFTLGLLLLAERVPRARGLVRFRWLLATALGALVVFAYFLHAARRYPGLFLSTLSSSHLLTFTALYGHVLSTVVVGASLAGYAATLFGPLTRAAKAGAVVILGLSGATFSLWNRIPWPHPTVFANPDVKALKGASGDLPNILVLAVDSLRPDLIDAENTPNIARLIEQSVYFPNALVTVPRTGPSWAATLTSTSPLVNGVETMFPSERLGRLKTLSLPAHLASLGYRTAVFSEYAGEFFGRVDFGFQVEAVPTVELREITGQMLAMRAPTLLAGLGELYTQGGIGRALLGSRLTNLIRGMSNFSHPDVLFQDLRALANIDAEAKGGRAPFFSLVFYSQPHFPYTSSAKYYPGYRVPGSSPELAFGRDATNETPITSQADRKQLLGLYRAALAETDEAIGKLVGELKKRHELERTLIVLLADHGEGLYECTTCVGHGDNLRSMLTLKVPLAFRLPAEAFDSIKADRSPAYVSQLDVYPTILSLLGKERMANHEGVALIDRRGRRITVPERTHFAETGEWLWPTAAVPKERIQYPVITKIASLERDRIVIDDKYGPEIRAAKYRAVVRPPYKLNYEPGPSGVVVRLYDFEKDPLEERDVAASEPAIVDDLMRQLHLSMIRHPKILPVAGYFLTRPDPPPVENW